MDPISAIINFVNFVFTSNAIAAQIIRFVGSTLITAALSGTKQPRLSDLKVQTSSYGAAIPRVYGTSVRITGNVVDKSDLIPVKHKKGEMFGIGGVKYYTYDAHVAVLLCEGPLPENSLKRIWADGKLVFDRDATNALPGTSNYNGVTDALGWTRAYKTHSFCGTVIFYRGTTTQGVDLVRQNTLHPGETLSAYRRSAYVVLERIKCSDFGNRVPNLEFEIEPAKTLRETVEELGDLAGAEIYANRLAGDTLRGYVVAQDGTAWSAIEPLAGVFAFDLIKKGTRYEAVKRGRYMRTVIRDAKLAARPVGEGPKTRKTVGIEDANKYPDEVTVTYWDLERDYQPNTQRGYTTQGFSENKINTEVPIVLTADEARDVAQRTLYETIARTKTNKFEISEEYRWLDAGDVVGLTIGGNIEPWRITTMTRNPRGVIEVEASFEDPFLYIGGLVGSAGSFPVNSLELPGDTIMQPIDGAIVRNAHDDTGFYGLFCGTGSGWRGAEVYRALGTGSPLSFEIVGNVGVEAVIGDATTTLADGPTNVWDESATVTVELLTPDATLSDATMEEVETVGANLAWLGAADGSTGEYFHFRTATPTGSPTQWVLSGLLRGRKGTEYATAAHGSGERFVLMNDADAMYRLDFGSVDWNIEHTYRSDSIPTDDDDAGLEVVFTNTGEGKRPLSPVHLEGVRNSSNNDVLIQWTRRSRYEGGDIAAAVPLGEETEAYEIDIYTGSPGTIVRTLTSSTPYVNYTTAQQTADGNTPGDPVQCDVYQMSSSRGRGRGASGVV